MQQSYTRGILLLSLACVLGFALMGFEMLGSRYLNPYFGGGITTWACLISVVLFAMMVGYFAGGYAVDARPGVELFVGCVLAAAAAILVIPPTADAVLQFLIVTLGDGFWGVLIASMTLSFVPVAFLSACSPFVVRLLLVDLQAGGKTAGLVYSVSTLGNVAGTLGTASRWLVRVQLAGGDYRQRQVPQTSSHLAANRIERQQFAIGRTTVP